MCVNLKSFYAMMSVSTAYGATQYEKKGKVIL